jgi:F0F1-type ATP synthase delta subunit
MLIWQLILIQAITALGIFIFLRLLFSHDLSAALKRLQELQRQNIEKEIALNKELELAKQNRQSEIERGKDEAKKLKDLARADIEKSKEQVLLKAKQEAGAFLTHAAQERELLKHQLSLQIEEVGVNLALGMIRDIFSQEARQELQRELVDELIIELRKIDKEKLKVETKKAEVTSSYPLLDNQKNGIREILRDVMGCSVELEEKTDASIISGLVINLGGLVLDGSLQNKLRKIIPYLKN